MGDSVTSKDEVWSDARIRDELRDYDPSLSRHHIEQIFRQALGLIDRQQQRAAPEPCPRYPHWTCKTHGDFDARVAVGCPECVRMMRAAQPSEGWSVTMLQFRLPFPPSVNHYWRHIPKGPSAGRVLISEEGRAYRSSCAVTVLEQRVPKRALRGKLAVVIWANPPDRRRRDLDNLLKSSLDALKHCGLIEDDGDIDDLHVTRGQVEKGGSLLVTMREIQ